MSRQLYPAKVEREPDGTTLICVTRRDVPLIALGLECAGGHRCNPRRGARGTADRPGLANLTTALLGEGPTGTTPLAWHRQLDARAIAFGVDASAAHWSASVHCLTEDVEHAVSMARHCLESPAMPRSEWKRFVKSYRAGAREQWAQPMNVIGPALHVQVLGYGHPAAHPAFEGSYHRARYDEACGLAANAFRRGPGTWAAVGGDLTAEEGFDHLRRWMANLPVAGGADAEIAPDASPGPAAASRAVTWVLDNTKVDQVFLALGRPGIKAGDPDRVALRLANYMLGGGGFSSRLMTRVRSDMGQTYGIHSALGEDLVTTLFVIQTFTKLENLGAMLDAIQEELETVGRDGFRPEELADAQDHFHGAVPLGLTAPRDVVAAVAGGLRAGLTIDDLQADWEKIRQLTLDDVNVAMRRLIADGAFHLSLVGPAEKLKGPLASRGRTAVFPFRSSPDAWHD